MTTKAYLMQIGEMEYKITELRQKVNTYTEMAAGLPSQSCDKDQVTTTPPADAHYAVWVEKKVEALRQIAELERKLSELKPVIIAQITKIDNNDYQDLLLMRYVNLCTWERICSKKYVSLSTAKRWHKFALNEFARVNRWEPS